MRNKKRNEEGDEMRRDRARGESESEGVES